MKNILILAALFAASIANAQTKAVLKNINGGTITESLTIGSGKTLTIASGATINATGATITGFTAAASWGAITGTLSAQTDLQSALDLKAPLASPTFTGSVIAPLYTADDANSNATADLNPGGFTFTQDDGFTGSVGFEVLTASRTWTIPNASGTFLFTNGSGSSLTALNATQLTSGTVPAARMPALTGDVTTSAGAVATTLATVNSNVGNFTNASITVNAKGLITAASSGTGGGITIGTTTSNGTAGRVLYTDGTNVQAYPVTGTGSVVMSAATDGSTTTVGTNSATPIAASSLTNSTAAISGTQSASPSVIWTGQGWKTTATAASQPIAFRAYALPVQGTTNPTGQWLLQSSINGGGWSDLLTLDTSGALIFNGTTMGTQVGMNMYNLSGGSYYIMGYSNTYKVAVQADSMYSWTDKEVALGKSTNSYKELWVAGVLITAKSGTPEGSVTAPVGSLCTDTATGTLYRKTSGTGNTGWVTP